MPRTFEGPARSDAQPVVRRRLLCRGAVQGVGFRPSVYRLASELGLCGVVRNDRDGATIEVEGPGTVVATFEARLPGSLTALARLESVAAQDLEPEGASSFEVESSRRGRRGAAIIPPDAALCGACRADMQDPADRRFQYAFTTCTDCGPRFTLVHSLPYDRERTAMASFPLCPACLAEYTDPGSRRFHAEPVCCPACGPPLRLVDADGRVLAEAAQAVAATRAALADSKIVAIHALGGFQLACLADDEGTVRRLRQLKHRPTKPFAVMVPDLDAACELVTLCAVDEELLVGPRGPILLAPRRESEAIAACVAGEIEDLGVMLPTTPMHVELFRDAPYAALVMTSGNRGDEPICRTPEQAFERLAGIADLFLVHEREVVRRTDDSVVRSAARGPVLVRRSRGWVPESIGLPVLAPEPILALGGHLQTTTCVAVGAEAFPSQHVGDLDTEPARAFLVEVGEALEGFLEARAGVIVVDQHPDYPSTWIGERLAAERGGRVLRVQHHLAHAASVLAERGRFPEPGQRAAALVLDGTGYGPDGTAWGAECLVLDGDLSWWRGACAEALPLVGGERAVREPWRVAVAALVRAGCGELLEESPLAQHVDRARLAQVRELATGDPWPLAHGAGRLFEAAGALLGLCVTNGWEGEAAVRLETCAAHWPQPAEVWTELELMTGDPRTAVQLPSAALLAALARRVQAGEEPARVARGFHVTFAQLAAKMARASLPDDVRSLGLTGGCLVNRLLQQDLSAALEAVGVEPLLPRALPPGDGGLSYGQAVLAAAALARGTEPTQRRDPACA